MKSRCSPFRFVVPVFFVLLVGTFVAYNSGVLCLPEPAPVVPAATEKAYTKEDSVLIDSQSRAKNMVVNPFPNRPLLPGPEREVLFPSSKSIVIFSEDHRRSHPEPVKIMGAKKPD